MDSATPQKAERGHIRSASLENNNSFILKNTLGLPLVHPPYQPTMTGTLKSRNEQKRLRQKFGSHSNLVDDYIAQSKTKFQNLRNIFEGRNSSANTPLTTQNELYLHNNHHHHHQQQQQQSQQQHHPQQAQAQIPSHKKSEFHEGNNVANSNLNIVENGSASQMHFDEVRSLFLARIIWMISFQICLLLFCRASISSDLLRSNQYHSSQITASQIGIMICAIDMDLRRLLRSTKGLIWSLEVGIIMSLNSNV